MGQIGKTTAQLNTLLSNLDGNADTNSRNNNGVTQIKNTTDGKYHTIWIETENGKPVLRVA